MIDDEETLKDNGLIEIDGVDVSDCEWLSYGYVYINCEKEYYCGQEANEDDRCLNRNCLFKNLKKELQRLKAENKELKEELELNTANAVVIEMAERLNKLKQALEEVRNYILDNSDFDKSDSLQSTTGAYDILKIVNEVFEDENH